MNLLKALAKDLQKKIRPDSIRSLGGGSNNNVQHNQYPQKEYQIEKKYQKENFSSTENTADHSDCSDRSHWNDRYGFRSLDSGTGQADRDGCGGGEE